MPRLTTAGSSRRALPERPRHARTGLPEYAERLSAFHRSHETELRRIIESLPIEAGSRVLDVACGDGTYSILMSERGAQVTGVDVDLDCVQLAARRAHRVDPSVSVKLGNAERLDCPDDAFDGAFCAQGFHSLLDVGSTLREMRRVVRPGGWVAALENDSLRHVVLPWPPELELKLRLAERQALVDAQADEDCYYIGRLLGAALERAGLTAPQELPFATYRRAPLTEDERVFLCGYLQELMTRAEPHLSTADREQALRLASPASPHFMLDAPDFSVTYLDVLACARVPVPPQHASAVHN